jgi:hypothetical protein
MQNTLRLLVALGVIILLVIFMTNLKRPPLVTNLPGEFYRAEWGLDPLWDDGQAEVATYKALSMIYGKSRSHETTLITVKEDFNPKLFVKADNPADQGSHPVVFKLNIAASIPADNYTYHFLTSVFVRREDVSKMFKLTVGSQEWCGNTFKEIRNWDPTPAFVYHSYFDGEGDGSRSLEILPGDLFEDQLPVTLRSLHFKEGLHYKSRIAHSLISNRAEPPRLSDSEITVAGKEFINTIDCWRVQIESEGLSQTYWMEAGYPNILVKSISSDGREMLLKDRSRRKYWLRPV